MGARFFVRLLIETYYHRGTCLGYVYQKNSIFEVLKLQIYAEMIRKAFGKSYRTQTIDLQVDEVPVSF